VTRARRVDANHSEIRDALRKVGYFVYSTAALGDGFPDLLVVDHERRVMLMEVKSRRGCLTWEEAVFAECYPGRYAIVRSAEEAIRAAEGMSEAEATK
jgi:hypothetical protein